MPGFWINQIRTDRNIHPPELNLLLLRPFNSCLSCCKSSDRDSAWGTADVVQADFVAEVDGLWITAVFAADADFQILAD